MNGMSAEQIARSITRAESDGASAEELRLYWKGAKSMLENFTDNYDFIEEVQKAFFELYE